jgi:internalin A
MQINIWDFGGQEIQYLTHQFFLTSDALYVLLTSARKDLDNLDYWFNIVRLLGKNEKNEHSKLLVVANEINMEPVKHFIEKDFRERYPDLDFECLGVNMATKFDKDGRFKSLQYKIEQLLAKLPSMGRELPVKWGVARAKLETKKANSIAIEKYIEICNEAELSEASAYDLSAYLHTIGEALHFQNDHKVEDFIILNPKWAVDAVYVVLKSEQLQQGHFTKAQVYRIWKDRGYTQEECSRLLRLMAKDNFEVCYPVPEKSDEFISPQLLPDNQPEYEWETEKTLRFRYSYPFMPKGILSRFVVRLHEDIEYRNDNGLVWKSGVVLNDSDSGYLAQIRETEIEERGFKRKVIDIELKGEKGHRRAFLRKICRNIEKIHNEAFSGLPFERLVPCNCPDCAGKENITFYDYSDLIKRINKNIGEVECTKEYRKVKINDIFEEIIERTTMIDYPTLDKDGNQYETKYFKIQDPFQAKQKEEVIKTIKIFIASSFELKTDRDAIRLFLSTLNDKFVKKGIYLHLEQWEFAFEAISDTRKQDDYNKILEKCDLMICLIGTKVGKYTKEEFEVAHKHFKENKKPQIFTYFKKLKIDVDEVGRANLNSLYDFKEYLKAIEHFPSEYQDNADLENKFRRNLDEYLDI